MTIRCLFLFRKTVVAFYKKGISYVNCHCETIPLYNLCCHDQSKKADYSST